MRIGGTFALAALVASRVNPGDLLTVARRIDLRYILPLLLLFGLERTLIAARWSILVRLKGHTFPVARALQIDLVSGFFGVALPSLATSDAVRGYTLFRQINDLRTAISALVFDRLLGITTLSLLALAGLFAGRGLLPGGAPLVWIVFTVLAATAGLLIAARTPWSQRLLSRGTLLDRLPRGGHARAVWSDFFHYQRSAGSVALVFLLSALTQIIRVVVTLAAARAAGSTLPLVYFFLFVPVVFVVLMLPISLGGIGAREASLALLFTSAGHPAEEGILAGILITLLTLAFALVGAILYARGVPSRCKPALDPSAGSSSPAD